MDSGQGREEPGFTFFRTVGAVETADVVAPTGVTGTTGSVMGITVRTTPSATLPRGSKASGWVAISAPTPVEILEDGRVIGASWNGGVRLTPGWHTLRLVNRGEAIDQNKRSPSPPAARRR